MERWLRCWSLAALLCALSADPHNGTVLLGADGQADEPHELPAAEILASLLQKGVLDVEKASAWRPGDDSSWSFIKAKKSPKKLPKSPASSAAPNSQVKNSDPSGVTADSAEPCVGCGGDTYTNGKSPSRALLSEHSEGTAEPMSSFVWPLGRGATDAELRKGFGKGDHPGVAESQEDSGSGDPHLKTPSSQVTHSSSSESGWDLRDFVDMATSSPQSTTGSSAMLGPSTEKAISPDSAEIDHLLPGSQETSVQTPSPADGYEDGGIEDEDDDLEEAEDLEEEVNAKDMRDFPKAATLTPKIQPDEKPTIRQDFPRYRPEGGRDPTQTMAGTGENGTDCRSGYIRRNNSCRSLCEIYPTYCHNGGQCYMVENIGAFCRCNTQDYIWHKGLRCESIITDFQVMCVAVGTAALVVLLLFMMTVFFAKKLYLLKTENYKLRKRNRYRTPSELHNDNFSLSTIAEGSHPNEDPNAPQKVQDLPKACLKDEEPFNIQNSMSPKHECSKGNPDIVDVNCVLNNLT